VAIKLFSKISSFEFTKRDKLILMSVFLTIVLVATQTVSANLRYPVMAFLAFSTLVLAVFSLWGELSGVKYFLLLLLPVYFVVGATFFYFLLPVRWLTIVPFALFFGVAVYLLMLTSNIYNVAAIRTIALLRAAHAVGLLFTITSVYFLSNVLFSFHLPFYLISVGVFFICAPLYLVGLWSYELEEFISRKVFKYAMIFSLITVEIVTVFAFWPILPTAGALAVSTIMYVLLGISQFEFQGRMKERIVWEHLGIALIVFVILLVSTHWGS